MKENLIGQINLTVPEEPTFLTQFLYDQKYYETLIYQQDHNLQVLLIIIMCLTAVIIILSWELYKTKKVK